MRSGGEVGRERRSSRKLAGTLARMGGGSRQGGDEQHSLRVQTGILEVDRQVIGRRVRLPGERTTQLELGQGSVQIRESERHKIKHKLQKTSDKGQQTCAQFRAG